MALIKCPECGKEISDKAPSCIHCGCPFLIENSATKRPALPAAFNLKAVADNIVVVTCDKCGESNFYLKDWFSEVSPNKCVVAQTITCRKCNETASPGNVIFSTVRCPKCKSTQIQMVPRKWSLMAGFATDKVDRVCMACKHKF